MIDLTTLTTPEFTAAMKDVPDASSTDGPLDDDHRRWLVGEYRAAQAMLDPEGPPAHAITVRIVAPEAPDDPFSEADLLMAVQATLQELYPGRGPGPVVPHVYRVPTPDVSKQQRAR